MKALAEHQHDELLIPVSVYAEILVAPYRRGSEAVAEVEALLATADELEAGNLLTGESHGIRSAAA